MKTMLEIIRNVLEEICERCHEHIKCCILFREDGFIIQSITPLFKNIEDRVIAAVMATILTPSMKLCKNIGIGEFTTILIEGIDERVLIRRVKRTSNKDIYLGILTTTEANLGLLLIEIEKVVEKLRKVIG